MEEFLGLNSDAVAAASHSPAEDGNHPCGVEVSFLNPCGDIGVVQPLVKRDARLRC